MSTINLTEIRECVAHGDRAAALDALRSAINQERIFPRDGVELMLAVRRGSPAVVAAAVEAMARGVPGAYRYVPQAEHAFA